MLAGTSDWDMGGQAQKSVQQISTYRMMRMFPLFAFPSKVSGTHDRHSYWQWHW